MSVCRCEQCSPDPLPTWTRRFREVCWMASMPSDIDRTIYLEQVRATRGRQEALELRAAAGEHLKPMQETQSEMF
jgi:hypothetical protein